MDFINNISTQAHFLRPWVWWFVPVLLALLLVQYRGQKQQGAWAQWCAPELLAYLQVGAGAQASRWRGVLAVGVFGLLALTAWAGPTWSKLPQPLYQSASALVLVLDLSQSMNAEDVKPSRLVRAKQKIRDVLRLRHDGQTALVVFAGSAHVVTPLTDDVQTIEAQLQALSTDIMPEQGSDVGAALRQSQDLLAQAQVKHGVVLLLTDAQALDKDAVKDLVAAGHRVDVIAVGTPTGAPIPKDSGGFVADAQGHIVIPAMHLEILQSLATLGQGVCHRLTADDADIQPVLAQLNPSLWQHDTQKKTQSYDVWYEQGPWLILLLLPWALWVFRRGVLVVALCWMVHPSTSQAMAWDDMWHTQQRQGEVLMQHKKYAEASKHLEDPAWQAAAHYRTKDYKSAVHTLQALKHPTADDVYNEGNALAHLGQLDAAIAAYQHALQMNPKLDDARANKKLLERLKKQQQSKKQQQKGGKKSSKHQKGQGKESKPSKSKDNDGSASKGDASKQAKDKSTSSAKSKQDAASKQQAKKQHQKQQQAKQSQGKQATQQNKQKQHALSPKELKKLEQKQAFAQTLRRVPDDPGGLLRRKFLYQYQQEQQQKQTQRGIQW